MIAKEADFLMLPQNMLIRTPLVELSNLVFSTDILVSHYIDEKVKEERFISYQPVLDIFVPSIQLLALYLALLTFSSLFVVTLNACLAKRKSSSNWSLSFEFLFNLFSQDQALFKRPTTIGQFFLFNLLFLFFVRNILTNGIKTRFCICFDLSRFHSLF